MLKINLSEFFRLVEEQSNIDHGTENLTVAVQKFLKKFGHDAIRYIAITNGKRPSYFIHIGLNSSHSCQIWQLNIPNMPLGKTLYPSGAGDAVAAGTIAAWHDLECWNGEESMILNNHIRSIFSRNTQEFLEYPYLYAFVFGLACGSASCLQVENSVMDLGDVLDIFPRIKPINVTNNEFK